MSYHIDKTLIASIVFTSNLPGLVSNNLIVLVYTENTRIISIINGSSSIF